MLVTDNEALYALFRPFGPNGAGEAYPLRAAAHAEADGAGDEPHTLVVSFTVAAGETSMGTARKLCHIPELEVLWLAC